MDTDDTNNTHGSTGCADEEGQGEAALPSPAPPSDDAGFINGAELFVDGGLTRI